MTRKKRKSKVEQQKKKILLESILDKWVCVKQDIDDEEKYLFIKHRLRDVKSPNRIEQIVMGSEPYECGVYYITDYEIDKILDMSENKEIIEICPIRFDLEIGLYSEKEKKITTFEELQDYLVQKDYISLEDINRFSDFRNKPTGTTEILLGYNHQKEGDS